MAPAAVVVSNREVTRTWWFTVRTLAQIEAAEVLGRPSDEAQHTSRFIEMARQQFSRSTTTSLPTLGPSVKATDSQAECKALGFDLEGACFDLEPIPSAPRTTMSERCCITVFLLRPLSMPEPGAKDWLWKAFPTAVFVPVLDHASNKI